jgi:hypothetical protein
MNLVAAAQSLRTLHTVLFSVIIVESLIAHAWAGLSSSGQELLIDVDQ